MIACGKTDGKTCKDKIRSFCNGLVTNCEDYEEGKPETQKAPAKKKAAKKKQ